MIRCNKCGQINLKNASVCSQCGNAFNEKPAMEELKSFDAQKLNINENVFSNADSFDEKIFEKSVFSDKETKAEIKIESEFIKNDDSESEIPEKAVPEKIVIQDISKKSEKKVVGNVSFEDEFDMCDMPPVTYADNSCLIPPEDKTALRNTALLAVVLAILIDAIVVICLLTYFKGFADKIVDVDYNISGKTGSVISDDCVYINGQCVRL